MHCISGGLALVSLTPEYHRVLQTFSHIKKINPGSMQDICHIQIAVLFSEQIT